MNEGELLLSGRADDVDADMAGRSFLLHSPQESNRRLLQRVLRLPQVSDGMIQGRSGTGDPQKRPPSTRFARARHA